MLIHVVPLAGATRSMLAGMSGGTILNALLLWSAFLFFVLKCADVRFLRWRLSRGSLGVLALACALIHHDVTPKAAGEAMLAELPTAAAASIVLEGLRRAARRIPLVVRGLAFQYRGTLARLARYWEKSDEGAKRMARRVLADSLAPRAPPAW